jgi:hypothetical protein
MEKIQILYKMSKLNIADCTVITKKGWNIEGWHTR